MSRSRAGMLLVLVCSTLLLVGDSLVGQTQGSPLVGKWQLSLWVTGQPSAGAQQPADWIQPPAASVLFVTVFGGTVGALIGGQFPKRDQVEPDSTAASPEGE